MVFKNIAAFQLWAGEKMRAVTSTLTEEEFDKKMVADRSVRDICTHIVMALETCFMIAENCMDESVYDEIASAPKDEILRRWEKRDADLATIIREIPQGRIEVPHLTEAPFEIDILDFYFQYMLHTTHHRGQLALALRSLGKEVPGTDYLMYFAEKSDT
ncbi:MAG: hypothetical protein EAX95_14325 [Candidatus Thorarchaeota archaeon]|nr:hypothetical protein [Candidatus Thorarchaeota archaeon]